MTARDLDVSAPKVKALVACLALAVASAPAGAVAQTTPPRLPPPPPPVNARIENVGFLVKPNDLPCKVSSPILAISLVGSTRVRSTGRIVVTRTVEGGSTPAQPPVKVPYALAVNEPKVFTATIAYVADCLRDPQSTFLVTLEPTEGG